MACKNCKSKKLANYTNKMQNSLLSQSNSFNKEAYYKTLGQITTSERIVVILFGFLPMAIGYITIIRFIISLL
tara:strand:+ start:164 stop:382 length:219 start_codon:yes stop_codon:yes gene_type:complete